MIQHKCQFAFKFHHASTYGTNWNISIFHALQTCFRICLHFNVKTSLNLSFNFYDVRNKNPKIFEHAKLCENNLVSLFSWKAKIFHVVQRFYDFESKWVSIVNQVSRAFYRTHVNSHTKRKARVILMRTCSRRTWANIKMNPVGEHKFTGWSSWMHMPVVIVLTCKWKIASDALTADKLLCCLHTYTQKCTLVGDLNGFGQWAIDENRIIIGRFALHSFYFLCSNVQLKRGIFIPIPCIYTHD